MYLIIILVSMATDASVYTLPNSATTQPDFTISYCINLYPTNAPDPFKPALYERTISVRCGHLNAPYSHVQVWNYSPTRYLHII